MGNVRSKNDSETKAVDESNEPLEWCDMCLECGNKEQECKCRDIMTEDKIRFSDLGLVRFVNHNWDLILCFGILLVVIHLW